jgi:hypothetical protein
MDWSYAHSRRRSRRVHRQAEDRSSHIPNRSLARYASVAGEAPQRWQEDRRPQKKPSAFGE